MALEVTGQRCAIGLVPEPLKSESRIEGRVWEEEVCWLIRRQVWRS